MDLKKHLRGRNLKWNWDSIRDYVLTNPALVIDLIQYCKDEETIVQQNAGAVLGKIVDKDKVLLKPHQQTLIEVLKTNPHDAVKRAIMRIFQLMEISAEVEGEVFDLAVQYLQDAEEPIAVKAFSMSSARKICVKYPDLAPELTGIIEILVEAKSSTGIVSRGKKELQILASLSL